ncbi:MAG TPA: sugar phosphate nucleotidyltransferase, partial [Kiritimatiellia bacterium]|nr:sugar phosphate nucleotidyltransferase [Kiritimatiellia bacterium]
MKKDLVVLAAGMGSRYGGLKQIDPVGPSGEKVIDYSVFDAIRAGFNRVVFVIRRDMEAAFRDGIGDAMESRLDVAYAFQEMHDLPAGYTSPAGREKPWGTGHAVWAARNVVNSPFAVINADDFYGPRAFELLAGHLNKASESTSTSNYAMIAYQLRQTVSEHGTVSRGLCRLDARGCLIDIEEVTAIEKKPDGIYSRNPDGAKIPHDGMIPVSMNCWGFTPGLFHGMESDFRAFLDRRGAEVKSEFYLPATISAMISRGEACVQVLQTPDAWYGVTYREDKPMVMAGIQSLIDRGLYP